MKQSEIKRLLEKFHSGDSLTASETEKLRDWYDSFEDKQEIDQELSAAQQDALKNRMWTSIRNITTAKVISFSRRREWWRYAIAAASIVILAGLAIWRFQINQTNVPGNKVFSSKIVADDILPGGNKATLTLANGNIIYLDQVDNGIVAGDQHTKVIKEESGKLAYKSSENTTGKPIEYNTITTPAGGQYQVILADGSKVWLNSMSSLKFPMHFEGKDRTVELTGEGYFEVAHNAEKTFYVKTGDVKVLALGTEFNVKSYGVDNTIQATLVSGSVRVTSQNQMKILKPFEQAVYQKTNGELQSLGPVDLDEVTAWKNGYFLFRNRKLVTILKDLEKWYDATIIYNAEITDSYSLRISRDVPVSKLLKFIELSGGVHFKIENQRIIVNK